MTPDDYPPRQDVSTNPYATPMAEDADRPFDPTLTGRTLNPWVSIWTQPRATMRQIVDTDPTFMVLPLAALTGIASVMSNATSAVDNPAIANTQPDVAIVIVGATIVGAVAGLLMWLLFSWLWAISARWIGGQATLGQMRAAYAWGSYPTIWTIPFSLLVLMFINGANTPAAAAALIVGGVGQMVIGIWSFVVLCKCIGEVSRFSAWKGWGTMILAGLLLVFPLIVFGAIILAIVVVAGSA